MVPMLSLCTFVCASTLLVTSGLGTEFDFCPDGYYFSFIDRRCRKCSLCPTNQVIKNPCTKYSDQKCSPFKFNDYISGGELSNQNQIDDFYGENVYYALTSDKKKNIRVSSQGKSRVEDLGNHTTVEKEDREYWKTLAFALIGLLSVLIIVATAVVLLACRKLQTVTVIKQSDEGEMGKYFICFVCFFFSFLMYLSVFCK